MPAGPGIPGLFLIVRTYTTRPDAKTCGHQPCQKMSICDGVHDGVHDGEQQRMGVEVQFRAAQPVRLHE